jgi:hypothetical protein
MANSPKKKPDATKIAGGPKMVSKKPRGQTARECDCEAHFAGLPAGLCYYDGDNLVVVEDPAGGGPYTLKWVNGTPQWINDVQAQAE